MKNDISIPLNFVRRSKLDDSITPRDFVILIFSFKRAQNLKNRTFKMLRECGAYAPYKIILSDDDPTISEYKEIFGEKKHYCFQQR